MHENPFTILQSAPSQARPQGRRPQARIPPIGAVPRRLGPVPVARRSPGACTRALPRRSKSDWNILAVDISFFYLRISVCHYWVGRA